MSHNFDMAVRFWDELVSRPSGPLAFRFILQPVMAVSFAIRDGIKDARNNRSPYLWTILSDPTRRSGRLHEGIVAMSRVLILGIAMDLIYQIIVLHGLRPLETLVVAFVLAFVPYLIVRGPVNRIARRIRKSSAEDEPRFVQRG